MTGQWIDKKHACWLGDIDTQGVDRNSIWECECGQQWQYGGSGQYGDSWWRYPVEPFLMPETHPVKQMTGWDWIKGWFK